MTYAPLLDFRTIKDLLLESSELTIMTETDHRYYTLIPVQLLAAACKSKPGSSIPIVSYLMLSQSKQTRGMELEFALVLCIKQLAQYLMGRFFTVRTDHQTLLSKLPFQNF
jgi:hypothetical protein